MKVQKYATGHTYKNKNNGNDTLTIYKDGRGVFYENGKFMDKKVAEEKGYYDTDMINKNFILSHVNFDFQDGMVAELHPGIVIANTFKVMQYFPGMKCKVYGVTIQG